MPGEKSAYKPEMAMLCVRSRLKNTILLIATSKEL